MYRDTLAVSGGGKERIVRIFISSTFQDMQEERNILVKEVFPRLRVRLLGKGVQLSVVDLRWGITQEEAERGEVVPVCLSQIDRCRPYFIGLLGNRYGWVPGQFSDDLVRTYPWLDKYRDRSLTELEMIHGVLNHPKAAKHGTFILLRDDEFSELGPFNAGQESSEDEPNLTKLRNLKRRLRDSGVEVYDYTSPPYRDTSWVSNLEMELEEALREDFPDKEPVHPLDIEAASHNFRAALLQSTYLARPDYFERLDRHLANGEIVAVTGAPGVGKSALLANYAHSRTLRQPSEFQLLHFSGAVQPASIAALLFRACGELQRRFHLRGTVARDSATLKAQFRGWVERAASKGSMILLLDGLDLLDDEGRPANIDWIPDQLPSTVRLVVSINTDRGRESLLAKPWPVLTVEPLNTDERTRFAERYLAYHSKHLNSVQLAALAASPACGNPLYLKIVLDELRQFGTREGLDEELMHYLAAGDLRHLFTRVLRRLEDDFGAVRVANARSGKMPLVRYLLSIICLSRNSLDWDKMVRFMRQGVTSCSESDDRIDVLKKAETLLTLCGEFGWLGVTQKGFYIQNETLKEVALARYLSSPADRMRLHGHLADSFGQLIEKNDKASESGLHPWVNEASRTCAISENCYHLFHSEDVMYVARLYVSAVGVSALAGLLTGDKAMDWLAETADVPVHEYLAYWLHLEAVTPARMTDAFEPYLQKPAEHPQARELALRFINDQDLRRQALNFLARETAKKHEWFFLDRGPVDSSYVNVQTLAVEALQWDEDRGADARNLLTGQATALLQAGDHHGALALAQLVKEACRKSNDEESSQLMLSFQADVHRAMYKGVDADTHDVEVRGKPNLNQDDAN